LRGMPYRCRGFDQLSTASVDHLRVTPGHATPTDMDQT
jgi:hypothetical protein